MTSKIRPRLFPLFVLLSIASLTIACGSGSSGRQLQSITVNAVSNGGEISFTATGTYNQPPITATPLPASWFLNDPPGGYQLTTQPFVVSCLSLPPKVTVMAPVDPNAPSSGSVSGTRMIVATAPILCS